jgi:hypothetical protein
MHGGYEKFIQNFWFEELKGKRPLRKNRHRWEDNIKMDLMEIGLQGVDLIHLAQDRDW